MVQQRNIAARAACWSACHRKLAILGWLAFVAAAVIIGGAAGLNYQREEDLGTGESGRADKIIAAGFADHAGEQVLVQSRGRSRSRIRGSGRRSTTSSPASPLPIRGQRQLAAGARRKSRLRATAARPWCSSTSSATRGHARARRVRARRRRTSQAAHPGFRIEELGDASANRAISQAFEDDARQAEFLSLPITLLILVAAFGTLVAAGLPLLLGLTAVARPSGCSVRSAT